MRVQIGGIKIDCPTNQDETNEVHHLHVQDVCVQSEVCQFFCSILDTHYLFIISFLHEEDG